MVTHMHGHSASTCALAHVHVVITHPCNIHEYTWILSAVITPSGTHYHNTLMHTCTHTHAIIILPCINILTYMLS